eukprot:Skav207818  [mRNA]  locus=scaffold4605:22375:24591:- [translate_table: standard]
MATITKEEFAKHNKAIWYDVTKFAGVHPGGTQILLEYAGKAALARRSGTWVVVIRGHQEFPRNSYDATEDFYALHRLEVLDKYQRLKKGRLADAKGPPPKKAQGFRGLGGGSPGSAMPCVFKEETLASLDPKLSWFLGDVELYS